MPTPREEQACVLLGFARGFSPTMEQVRDAYRRRARECHPDRNPSPRAAQQFIMLTHAMEVLTGKDVGQPLDTHDGHEDRDEYGLLRNQAGYAYQWERQFGSLHRSETPPKPSNPKPDKRSCI